MTDHAATAQRDLPFGKCRSVSRYQITHRIGEGTYGTVYKAEDPETNTVVALKRVKMEKITDTEGFPMTVLREIQILKRIAHKNVVKLKEIVVGPTRDKLFLVFEYCEHDLAHLLDHMKTRFLESEIKCILKQLLEALNHLHENWIIHRDLKLSNLLLNNQGILKLADFGLARLFSSPSQPYTPTVVTLWYRAPELLLGETNYSTSLDMWAVGCIFAELWLHSPLLPGKTEIHQLQLIFRLLGSPNERIWPGFSKLPNVSKIVLPSSPYSNLQAVFHNLPAEGYDLLQRLLTYDPSKRLSAKEALNHPFFTTSPLPKPTHLMPTFPPTNLSRHRKRSPEVDEEGQKKRQHATDQDLFSSKKL